MAAADQITTLSHRGCGTAGAGVSGVSIGPVDGPASAVIVIAFNLKGELRARRTRKLNQFRAGSRKIQEKTAKCRGIIRVPLRLRDTNEFPRGSPRSRADLHHSVWRRFQRCSVRWRRTENRSDPDYASSDDDHAS